MVVLHEKTSIQVTGSAHTLTGQFMQVKGIRTGRRWFGIA
jgi:hypothetical protein